MAERQHHPYGSIRRDSREQWSISWPRRINDLPMPERRRRMCIWTSGRRAGSSTSAIPTRRCVRYFERLMTSAWPGRRLARLRYDWGARTWFHDTWTDYTSESGENSATRSGIGEDVRRNSSSASSEARPIRARPAAAPRGGLGRRRLHLARVVRRHPGAIHSVGVTRCRPCRTARFQTS